ncbi:PAS-domain containing protein [Roseobacter sp.]|uniref:PAS-domain containing protein n=1 Tax=Roseobacter sp. TaxID=1907202 RepID=UPI002600D2DA|nr:PAS-domain containing protein [Roseobacter sp.]
MTVWDIAISAGAAIVSTLAALVWILSPRGQSLATGRSMSRRLAEGVSFLFDNKNLHHASEIAMQMYNLVPGQDDWQTWRDRMLSRFPDVPASPDAADGENITVQARHVEDKATLCLTRRGRFTQVQMIENGLPGATQTQQMRALTTEANHLRRASDTTSHAIWQVNEDGKITWYNAAYERLYSQLHNTRPRDDRPVFEIDTPVGGTTDTQRVSSQSSNGARKDWYDVSAVRVGGITVFHALNVNVVVRSEIAQRNFVQTLAKTFAQLSIGLAIFDRNGQLALFNPALIDLTSLPADFLSGRPTLLSFFDRMRENRRMPEPKNYKTWREEISDVIAAATDGRYQETWTLESGQTYRVKGRPHPDGAIAFLIEDISAEVSMTRNFRAELELGQSLMDTFDEALVVFSSTGVLSFCNRAYRELWGLDPDSSFADVTISDSVREWKRMCKSGARWPALVNFVLDYGDRVAWEMPATLSSGVPLLCTVSRIASGATVVRFVRSNNLPARRRRTIAADRTGSSAN